MSSKRWRFIAEMIGIAAIVVSLAAVVVELRQTQSALVAATYQARAFQAIEQNIALQDSEYTLPLLARVDLNDLEPLKSLSPLDNSRLRVFFTSVRIDADNEYYQYENGYLDEAYYQHTLRPTIKINAPIWRALDISEPRPSFKQLVDEVLAE